MPTDTARRRWLAGRPPAQATPSAAAAAAAAAGGRAGGRAPPASALRPARRRPAAVCGGRYVPRRRWDDGSFIRNRRDTSSCVPAVTRILAGERVY